MTKALPIPPQQDLEQMYLTDKKSSYYIADKYNCDHKVVLRWLHMYKIPVRTHCKEWDKPTKEILEELYIDRHLSARRIGEMYGVSFGTVLRLLRHYDMDVQPRGSTPVMIKTKKQQIEHDKRRNVCNTLKKHADDLKDDPERLSTEFMQNLIGVQCDDIV